MAITLKIPLSVAFPFKSISIVYSLILGYLIFNEIITINKIFGIIIIIFGIVWLGLKMINRYILFASINVFISSLTQILLKSSANEKETL